MIKNKTRYTLWVSGDKTYALNKTNNMIEGVCITDKPNVLYSIILADSMKSFRDDVVIDDLIIFVLAYEFEIERKKNTIQRCMELEEESFMIRDDVRWEYNAIRGLQPNRAYKLYLDYVFHKLGLPAKDEN